MHACMHACISLAFINTNIFTFFLFFFFIYMITHTYMHPLTRTSHASQTRDHINDELLSSFPIGKIDSKSGLCRPISYETTHQWMLMCGCKYKTFQKTYYNDTHERHDNQLDRVTKASRHLFVSLREEKWYCISTVEKNKMQQKYADWYSPRTPIPTHTHAHTHIRTHISRHMHSSPPPGHKTVLRNEFRLMTWDNFLLTEGLPIILSKNKMLIPLMIGLSITQISYPRI